MSALVRLIIIAGIGPLVTLHLLVPLFQTFLPIWRESRRDGRGVSWELVGRLMTRLAMVVLALIWILFTLEELRPNTFILEVMRWAMALAWAGVGIGVVISWVSHSHGMRGL